MTINDCYMKSKLISNKRKTVRKVEKGIFAVCRIYLIFGVVLRAAVMRNHICSYSLK